MVNQPGLVLGSHQAKEAATQGLKIPQVLSHQDDPAQPSTEGHLEDSHRPPSLLSKTAL